MIPRAADSGCSFAPLIVFVTAIVGVAVIPFGGTIKAFGRDLNLYITDLNVGALFILAFSSIGVYGIIPGRKSANRFSLLGGLLQSAAAGGFVRNHPGVVAGWRLSAGRFACLRDITPAQQTNLEIGPLTVKNWFILSQPWLSFCFMIAAVAETNRALSDLPEAESELVSGFHTEYSAFRFSFYFLGEYISMIVVSLFAATLFLGGPSGSVQTIAGASRGILYIVP
ncbi:MAG: NADH-quinone oxidoreductase subunit H [Thermomicrobiales bacterium]